MKKGLLRGLAGITASLCAMLMVGSNYAEGRSAFINARLGTSSVKLVETGDGSENKYHFKSEFETLTDVVNAKKDLAVQIASEGSVLLKNANAALPMDPAAEKVTVWGHNSLFTARGGMIGSTASAAEGQEN